jgi:integrase
MAHPEMRTLSPEQVQLLLATAAGDRSEAIYVLAVTTGMRQGELLGLHWRDVDLDRSVLSVTCTLQRATGRGLVLQEPKTLRSRRQIWLGRTAVEAIHRRRTNQLTERLHAGPSWKDTDLVFTTELGGPRDAHDVRLAFDRLLTQAGLPRVRFHDLRHTAATLMLGQGVHPKVAADMLGHATVAVTLDTYSHVTSGMHEAAAEALDRIVRLPS